MRWLALFLLCIPNVVSAKPVCEFSAKLLEAIRLRQDCSKYEEHTKFDIMRLMLDPANYPDAAAVKEVFEELRGYRVSWVEITIQPYPGRVPVVALPPEWKVDTLKLKGGDSETLETLYPGVDPSLQRFWLLSPEGEPSVEWNSFLRKWPNLSTLGVNTSRPFCSSLEAGINVVSVSIDAPSLCEGVLRLPSETRVLHLKFTVNRTFDFSVLGEALLRLKTIWIHGISGFTVPGPPIPALEKLSLAKYAGNALPSLWSQWFPGLRTLEIEQPTRLSTNPIESTEVSTHPLREFFIRGGTFETFAVAPAFRDLAEVHLFETAVRSFGTPICVSAPNIKTFAFDNKSMPELGRAFFRGCDANNGFYFYSDAKVSLKRENFEGAEPPISIRYEEDTQWSLERGVLTKVFWNSGYGTSAESLDVGKMHFDGGIFDPGQVLTGNYRYLRFQNLGLTEFPPIAGSGNLALLELSGNKLTRVQARTFVGFRGKTLNLSQNPISEIEASAFEGADIDTIILMGNPLVKIAAGAFARVRSLRKVVIELPKGLQLDGNEFGNFRHPISLQIFSESPPSAKVRKTLRKRGVRVMWAPAVL